MIRLIDLIQLAGVELDEYKIHFATESPDPWDSFDPSPLAAFLAGNWKEWQEGQNQKNFGLPHILSLIHWRSDRWLFAGVYEVNGVNTVALNPKPRYRYDTTEVLGLEHLVGRAVIRFEKKFRQPYALGRSYGGQLVVIEIREDRLSVAGFPGYNRVRISFQDLRTIVREEVPTWHTALSNVSGIYVVVDTTTGKQYIGSAYGEGGFWQRWKVYSETRHGNNKDLIALLEKEGKDHANNFQFSILEVADLNAGEDRILDTEEHWKKVLCTRKHHHN
jgi:hypothetical protein